MQNRNLKVIEGNRKAGSPWRRRLFVLTILLLCAYLLYHSLIFFSGSLLSTVIVCPADNWWDEPISIVLLKEEYLLQAPQSGQFIPQAEPGQRIKVGQVVGEVQGAERSITLTSPVAGLISYALDGWEQTFPPGLELNDEATDLFAAFIATADNPARVEDVQRGQVLAVVINNIHFALAASLDNHPAVSRQTIRLHNGGDETEVAGRISEVFQRQDRYWVKWEVPLFPDSLALNRCLQGSLLLQSDSLCELPEKAIIHQRDESGVLMVSRGTPSFHPVEIVGHVDDRLLVDGLTEGQQVLIIPWWGKFIVRWWLD